MANDLNITQLATDSASPEVVVNDAVADVADAMNDDYDVDLSAGNKTITAAQYRSGFRFNCSGVATTGRTVTLPAVKRTVVFVVPSTATNTISLIKGSTTLTLSPGVTYIVHTDGTANSVDAAVCGEAAGSTPYDFYAFVPGVMVNSMTILGIDALRAFTFPISLTGSVFKAGVAATGSTTVTLLKNGVSIGTVVWSASGTTGAITFAGAVSFAVGDIFTMTGPATADATLANIRFNFKGTR